MLQTKVRLPSRDRIKRFSCLISFVVTCIMCIAGMWLVGMLPGGKYCAVFTDTMDQMAGMQAMLARQLKAGENIFYSFETSMGQNTALLYAFCAYSPSTLFYMLIPDVYTATILGIIVKIAFSAMCFHLFLQYGLRVGGGGLFFFPLCYAMCGYSFEYMLSTNLLDGLYLLPLVMLVLMRALRKKRFALLGLSYALSFVIQFYCGFLIGLFSAAAFVGILWLKDGRAFLKKNIRVILRYVFCVFSAILLSMCLLLPAIFFFRDATGFNSILWHAKIKPWDILYGFSFGRHTSLETDIPFLYCGLPVLMLLPLYFSDRRFPRRERILMGAALVSLPISLYFDPLYFFLHAFNRPDGFTVRYAFLFVFLFVILGAREADANPLAFFGGKRLALYIAMVAFLHTLVVLAQKYFGEWAEAKSIRLGLWVGLILIIMWGVAAFGLRKWGRARIGIFLYLLLCVELCVQFWYNGKEQGLSAAENYQSWDAQMKSFLTDKKADEMGFYRAHLGNAPNANQNAIYGYAGIGQFASGNDARLYELLRKLGDAVSAVRYTQEGATDATDMIFSVRYRGYLTRADIAAGRTGPAYELYERALPIGYFVSSAVLEDIRFDGNVFENQNRMISAMCGVELPLYRSAEVWAHEESNATYTENAEDWEIRKEPGSAYGEVLFGIPKEGAAHAYAYFQLIDDKESEGEVMLDEDMLLDIAAYSPADRKGSGARFEFTLGNSIIEMTPEDEEFYLRFGIFGEDGKVYRYIRHYFYYQNEELLDAVAEYLREGGIEIQSMRNTQIEAKVWGSQEKPLLFLSIPYDRGWNVFVDGEMKTVLPVFGEAFMAVEIPPGEHSIVLTYEAPGAAEGGILTAAGAVLWLLLLWLDIRKSGGRDAA